LFWRDARSRILTFASSDFRDVDSPVVRTNSGYVGKSDNQRIDVGISHHRRPSRTRDCFVRCCDIDPSPSRTGYSPGTASRSNFDCHYRCPCVCIGRGSVLREHFIQDQTDSACAHRPECDRLPPASPQIELCDCAGSLGCGDFCIPRYRVLLIRRTHLLKPGMIASQYTIPE
jgi:hypothetical protein